MIYEHWWELRCFPNEGSRQAWIAQTMTWDGRLKKWYSDLRAKPKVLGREFRVCFWLSDCINVPLWSSSWHWLMRMIWCRDLTPGANQFVVEFHHRPLSNRWCTFQRMSVFQLLGEISANVLLTIMTNKSSVVPEICRWMVSEVRQFCWLTQIFSDRASGIYREEYLHMAHLWPHECRESCLKTNRIYLFCMAVDEIVHCHVILQSKSHHACLQRFICHDNRTI